ncbi:MAG: hypothetical protein EOO85_07475 [Pedobacter sp.]|nr:MAG: hypothetical protein EOO85_07475 [Pedobacter sp.]
MLRQEDMRYWSWQVVIYLMAIPIFSRGQALKLAPLPYKVCEFNPLYVPEKDSLRKQVILDSISVLLAGRWQLVLAGGGACFAPPYAPDEYIEMLLDSQGHGLVYQQDKLLTTFRLRLTFYWTGIRFLMDETRSPTYFDFFPTTFDKTSGWYERFTRRKDPHNPYATLYRNSLRVCEETLYMSGPRTGTSYVFKRLTP